MNINMTRSMRRRGVMGGALFLAAAPGLCAGQVRSVDAYPVIVTESETALRSGDSGRFYAVRQLKKGDVLQADGESAEWIRVAYPAGQAAVIKADQGEAVGDGTVKLTKPSRLLALHAAGGVAASWKGLLSADAPAGTIYSIVETVKDANGTVIGYLVKPPAEARGFVSAGSVRKATPAEVAAAAGAAAPVVAASVPATPAPVTVTTPQPAVREVAPSGETGAQPASVPTATPPTPAESPNTAPPADGGPASTPAPTPIDLTAPTSPTGQAPTATDPGTTPAATSTPAGEATPPPVEITQQPAPGETTPDRQPADAAAVVEAPKPLTAEDLEPLFQGVRRQPVLEAEIDELLAEYERQIAGRPLGDRRRRQLEQRAEVLRLMHDYRNKRRAIEEGNRAARQSSDEFSRRFAAYDTQRTYAMVGLLMPSTVYDGSRLPLMYRLQSVGGSVPRTLGYIRPEPSLALESKLGVVVGVVGETKLDSSLRLTIIEPVRVDPLRAAENPIKVTP